MTIGYSLLLLIVLVILAQRTRNDKEEYAKFKRLKNTLDRQRTYKKWVIESFLIFGGLSLLIALIAGKFVHDVLQGAKNYSGITGIKDGLHTDASTLIGFCTALLVGATLPVLLPLIVRKKSSKLPVIGDIEALLPRNKQELKLGALLSVNAGIVEELFFRLTLPALVYGAFGNAAFAIGLSCVVFGLLHYYQGIVGVVGTLLIGVFMMGAYLASGTIFLPMVLHALIDLRSLVLLPIVTMHLHRQK